MRKRFAVVVGLPNYAKYLAELMNEHSANWRMRAFKGSRAATFKALAAIRGADALISFGGPGPNVALVEAARRRNIPIVVVWAGSDVVRASEFPLDLQMTESESFTHIADGPWLVDELRVLGIEAEYLPLTAVAAGPPVPPLPGQFRVLTYLPEPRRDFYGEDLTYRLARAMPDTPFWVVGEGSRPPDAPENVRFFGLVPDAVEYLDACTVLLRVPKHDGKSMFVLEALSRRRHVVWNYEFPFVRIAHTFDDVLRALQRLRTEHEEGRLEPNSLAREYVLEEFGRERIARNFERKLDSTCSSKAVAQMPRRARRVAISGLSLFCAQVANLTKAYVPGWDVRLIHTGSRLQVLTGIYNLLQCDVWYTIGTPRADLRLEAFARMLGKPRVLHWVGSDMGLLQDDPAAARALAAPRYTHLTEVDWTKDELRRAGINGHIAPLPPRQRTITGGVERLPENFTVLLYVPRTRAEFYGKAAFERLVREFAGEPIRYLVVGGGYLDAPEGAPITNIGWRENLVDAYKSSTALVRFTPQDGLSLMVLEALSLGRHVLWTQPFPHVRTVHDYGAIERNIGELLGLYKSGRLSLQTDAMKMIAQEYAPDRCARQIAAAWDMAVAAGARGTAAPATSIRSSS